MEQAASETAAYHARIGHADRGDTGVLSLNKPDRSSTPQRQDPTHTEP